MNRRNMFTLFIVAGLLLLAAALRAPLPSAQAQASPDATAKWSGIAADEDWWSAAQAYITRSEYFITWEETPLLPGDPAAYQAPNRVHNLRTYFHPDGLRIVRRTESQPSWVWGLSLSGYGDAVLSVEENHITYRRGLLTETYVNSPQGVEQSLEIARPRQDSPLVLEFTLRSDLLPHRDGANGFEFWHQGEAVLHYGDLSATDAMGNRLPVRAAALADVLRITVDDTQAIYPLHLQAWITGLPYNPDWAVTGDIQSANLGHSVATAGDVNGDGYSDVIVGIPGYPGNGLYDAGAVFVYYGSANGLSSSPSWSFQGNQAYMRLGAAVATAGDINDDGYSDVIVGAPYYSNGDTGEGLALVFHGSNSGLSSAANWFVEGEQYGANLGRSVATAGDVNGDGYSDVIIGAPGYSDMESEQGAAYVWFGSAGGLGAASTPSNADWWTVGAIGGGNQRLGYSVSTAGDVNGDGFSDIIIGSPSYDAFESTDGKVDVYYGSSSGLQYGNQWDAYGGPHGAAGTSVSTAGDVNGDGYADIIIGLPSRGDNYEGAVRIFHGSSSGLSNNWALEINGTVTMGSFGSSVATAGDVNGDGYADVIIGEPWGTNGQANEGVIRVYYGSSGGVQEPAAWTRESNLAYANLGAAVATAGDVNGDGFSDVIAGAPLYADGETDEGAAFVWHGGPDDLSQSPGWTYESDYADKNLGQAVATAGDVNGDGYADILVGAPAYDSGQTDEGAVFAWYGSDGGFGWGGPDWSAYSDQANAQLGYAVSTAGDVDGDGYSDIIVGAPYYDNGQSDEGAAFLWLGSGSGLGGDGAPSNADWLAESNQANAHLGWDVATAGDVNNDGYADIAIGAPSYDNGQTDEGAVFVWHGDSAGLGANGTPANADWRAESDIDNRTLGLSVDTAGDVNRDGYSDIIAGANGVAGAWYGSPGGLSSSASWAVSNSGLFGQSVATAGDVNGDGYSDVIIGAPFYNGAGTADGGAWVYMGGNSGLNRTPNWMDYGGRGHDNAAFGWSVSTAGDVNGDGYADIIVGAPLWSNPITAEGQVRVYYGSASGPISLNGGDWTVEGNATTANLGYAVSTAGDVNGDGYADVLIGAPQYSNGQTSEGRAYLYWGNGRMGKTPHPRQLHTDGATPIAPLGLSDSEHSFKIKATLRPASGRGTVHLCWEVKPLSSPFNGNGLCLGAADSATGGVTVPATIDALASETRFHWRVRTKYDPVTNPFEPPYGRWIHMPWNGWNEADFRTAGGSQPACSDAYEPNEDFASAKAITPGAAIQAYICDANDQDWFKFNANAGQEIDIDLTQLPADYDMELRDPGNHHLQSSANSGTDDEHIHYAATSSGTYRVHIFGYNGAFDATNPYTLRVQLNGGSAQQKIYEPIILK